jgi:tripartite-type tricarboxylate transporter receptor subunit TctC
MAVRRRSALAAAAAFAAPFARVPGSRAQERQDGGGAWAPGRPVRVLVSTAAGGGSDTAARLVGPRLSAALGQPVVVDNRPGGAGNVANEALAQSPPDGHTVQLGTIGNLAVNPLIQKNLPVDPLRDFAHVAMAMQVTNLLVVPAGRPWRALGELLAAMKAQPGALSYGSSGVGSAGHLAGALLDRAAGVQGVHVPYRGGGQLISDILSGKVDYAFATAATTLEHVHTGRLRALAVPTAERSALLPEVPAVAEAGLPGYAVANWYALVAPRGTPRPAVLRLNAAWQEALRDAEVVRKLAHHGIEPMFSTPEGCTEFMASESAKWAEVVREARIGVD